MKDIQWSFVSLATASLSHLLLRIVLGKELGPLGLGLYTLVFTIYMFGMQFSAFGIGSALTKYVAQYNDDKEKIKDFVFSGVIGSLISGLIMGALLYILSSTISISFFHSPDMIKLLKLTAFCFPFIAMQKTTCGALNGLRRMDLFAFINILQNVGVMALSIVLVMRMQMGVYGAVVGFVVPTIIIGIFSLLLTRKYISIPKIIQTSILKKVVIFGSYIALANSVGLINTQMDSLMIGYYLDKAEVGYYAVAIILMQGLVLIPQSIQRVTTPAIANIHAEKNYKLIRKLIKMTMFKTLLISILITLILIIVGMPLITILFTDEFTPAYVPMVILSIGYTCFSPIISVGEALSSVGKFKIGFRIALLCAISNIILNLVMVPIYGILGAAVATSSSLIIALMIHTNYIKWYIYN